MRLIKEARWKEEHLPGAGHVKRELVSGKMYRLQKNKSSLESASGNGKLPSGNGLIGRQSQAIFLDRRRITIINFTTSTPHDALSKTLLTHPDAARDFTEIRLPKDLRELCDLDSLKLESASFIDEKLWALHPDILWSVETREDDGYIYVAIEHQSRENVRMVFYLIRYSMVVMQRHIERDKRQPLPLIISMLFCRGSRNPYPWSLCWLDKFVGLTIARKLYNAMLPLMDVTVMPDDGTVQYRRVTLLGLIQKYIRRRNLMGLVDQLIVLLATRCTNSSQITALLDYILLTGDEVRLNGLISELTRQMPQHRGRMMMIAERIHNDEYIKGEQRILRLLLWNGADPEWIQKITGLSTE